MSNAKAAVGQALDQEATIFSIVNGIDGWALSHRIDPFP
jgi:hypothetical protein